MAMDTALRCVHYAHHRLLELALPWLERVDVQLQKPESKTMRVALAAIFYFGSLLAAATLSWKWVAVCYAVQTLLDMYISPRTVGQRWDEIMGSGLNFGLAIRASVLVIGGLYRRSILQTAQGVFWAGSLFFKQDLDQYDWIAYVQPWQASLIRRISSAKDAVRALTGSGRSKGVKPVSSQRPVMARRLDFTSAASETDSEVNALSDGATLPFSPRQHRESESRASSRSSDSIVL